MPEKQLAVLRRFPFNPALQRSSVLAFGIYTDRVADAEGDSGTSNANGCTLTLFSKGAPEKIASLCIPETGTDRRLLSISQNLSLLRIIELLFEYEYTLVQ